MTDHSPDHLRSTLDVPRTIEMLAPCAALLLCLLWPPIPVLPCGPSFTEASSAPEGEGRPGDEARRRPAAVPDGNEAVARACAWLWDQQGPDGGWHSETYGLLKSGQAYTPFILHTLLTVPEKLAPRPSGGVRRALDFIRRKTNGDGILGVSDPDVLEYPNYATAYALRCLVRAGGEDDRDLVDRMKAYLVSQQYGPLSGFGDGAPAYGGWGFGGRRPRGSPGHMDLAHTRRCLQALREAGVEDETVLRRAQTFLRLVQRHPAEKRPQPPIPESAGGDVPYDGGFYFSPVVLAANKGRVEPGGDGRGSHYRSYATATCDGLMSLLAAGVPPDDERVSAAIGWLKRHSRHDYPEGIPEDHPEPWGGALHFYHLAVRSEAYAELDWGGGWREEIVKILPPLQRSDGSFVNSQSHLMKEDDPLLATTLAVIALAGTLPR